MPPVAEMDDPGQNRKTGIYEAPHLFEGGFRRRQLKHRNGIIQCGGTIEDPFDILDPGTVLSFDVRRKELEKIAEKGLTTSNLETAYKLVDMYKDLKNTEYWETKGEYYDTVLMEMQGGYSQNDGYSMMEDDYSMRGRKRDRMGRYSREDGMGGQSYARGRGSRGRGYSRDGGYSQNDGGYSMYDRYMDAKQSYRSNKSMDGKQKLMESLEDYMDDFTEKIKEMHRDAETGDERELISKFLGKLQNIR